MTENSFPVCLVMRDGTSSSTVRCLPAARTSTELTSWIKSTSFSKFLGDN